MAANRSNTLKQKTHEGSPLHPLSQKAGHHNKRISSKVLSGMDDKQSYYDDQTSYNNGGGEFSQRSMGENYGMHTERKLMMQEESEQLDESLNDSFDDDGPNNLKYSDFKEDRQIVKSAA